MNLLGSLLMVSENCDVIDRLKYKLAKKEINKVKVVNNGFQALQLFNGEHPDLVIIDKLLPDSDGIEICKEIRKKSEVPIFLLSTDQEMEAIITSYEAGVSDYIIKPFDTTILAAKVYANLKRNQQLKNTNENYLKQLKFNHLEIDIASCTVSIKGKPINLIAKELQILLLLTNNPNQVFSAEQLYQQIWGLESFGDARTVMVHISNLRKKIEEDPSNPKYIQTIRGFGYKFHTTN